LVKQII